MLSGNELCYHGNECYDIMAMNYAIMAMNEYNLMTSIKLLHHLA